MCVVMFSTNHPSGSTAVISSIQSTSVLRAAFCDTSKKRITISPAYFVCVANVLTVCHYRKYKYDMMLVACYQSDNYLPKLLLPILLILSSSTVGNTSVAMTNVSVNASSSVGVIITSRMSLPSISKTAMLLYFR